MTLIFRIPICIDREWKRNKTTHWWLYSGNVTDFYGYLKFRLEGVQYSYYPSNPMIVYTKLWYIKSVRRHPIKYVHCRWTVRQVEYSQKNIIQCWVTNTYFIFHLMNNSILGIICGALITTELKTIHKWINILFSRGLCHGGKRRKYEDALFVTLASTYYKMHPFLYVAAAAAFACKIRRVWTLFSRHEENCTCETIQTMLIHTYKTKILLANEPTKPVSNTGLLHKSYSAVVFIYLSIYF